MVRQSEFKPRFDPELGRYAMNISMVKELWMFSDQLDQNFFGKTAKELAKKGAKTAAEKAVTKLVSLLVIKQVIK